MNRLERSIYGLFSRSRREFLTSIGQLSVLPGMLMQDTSASRIEAVQSFQPLNSQVHIDFLPPNKTDSFRQIEDIDNIAFMNDILRGNQISVDTFLNDIRGLGRGRNAAWEQLHATSLLAIAFGIFYDHVTTTVAPVEEDVSNRFERTTQPLILAVQRALSIEKSDLNYRDALGNPGIELHFDLSALNGQLDMCQEPILGLAVQNGNVRFVSAYRVVKPFSTLVQNALLQDFEVKSDKLTRLQFYRLDPNRQKAYLQEHISVYDKQNTTKNAIPLVRGKGAYSDFDGRENFQGVIDMAERYPEKVICAVGGNYYDYVGYDCPQNLITVGQWDARDECPRGVNGIIRGTMLNCDNVSNGFRMAREYGTTATSTVVPCAGLLHEQGFESGEIPGLLLSSCDDITYTIPVDQMLSDDGSNLRDVIEVYVDQLHGRTYQGRLFNIDQFKKNLRDFKKSS